jgi:hypothetical protein
MEALNVDSFPDCAKWIHGLILHDPVHIKRDGTLKDIEVNHDNKVRSFIIVIE